MKKYLSIAAVALIGLSACGNNQKQYISVDDAKLCALEEIDDADLSNINQCNLMDVGLENHIYRIFATAHNVSYEIDLDALTGAPIQFESESVTAGNQPGDGLETKDIGKEEIKNIIRQKLPGIKEFEILKVDYDFKENNDNATYNVTAYQNNFLYEFTLEAASGNILDSKSTEVGPLEDEEDLTNKSNPAKEESHYDLLKVKKAATNSNARPVWVQGHRCNTNYKYDAYGNAYEMKDQKDRETWIALNGGCNGVEVDLMRDWDNKTIKLSHSGSTVHWNSETLQDFLSLPEMKDPRMCLIIFDIKEPEMLSDLIQQVHDFQIDPRGNVNLHPFKTNVPGGSETIYFIYSVGALSKANAQFYSAVDKLWSNEGLCVDMDNDYDGVDKLFTKLYNNTNGAFDRGWYGNGVFLGTASFGIRGSCKSAVEYRDAPKSAGHHIKKVENWTVQFQSTFERLINWNVDSVMVNDRLRTDVSSMLKEYPSLRIATRDDYPF